MAGRAQAGGLALNILLLESGEIGADGRARLSDRRHEHARCVLDARPGDVLRVGELDGRLGTARVLHIDARAIELEVVLDCAPPPPLPTALAVALPRPPTLRKLLQQATALGVKRLAFFGAARVEKSYWQSRELEPAALDRQLRLGLEQARDTVRPEIAQVRRFSGFSTATLRELAGAGAIWLADAGGPPPPSSCPALIVVGPEGGLIDAEIGALEAAGAVRVGLGTRPLRVETAAVALLGVAALFSASAAPVEPPLLSGGPRVTGS